MRLNLRSDRSQVWQAEEGLWDLGLEGFIGAYNTRLPPWAAEESGSETHGFSDGKGSHNEPEMALGPWHGSSLCRGEFNPLVLKGNGMKPLRHGSFMIVDTAITPQKREHFMTIPLQFLLA